MHIRPSASGVLDAAGQPTYESRTEVVKAEVFTNSARQPTMSFVSDCVSLYGRGLKTAVSRRRNDQCHLTQ